MRSGKNGETRHTTRKSLFKSFKALYASKCKGIGEKSLKSQNTASQGYYTDKQIEGLVQQICGECWCCEHGKPYRTQIGVKQMRLTRCSKGLQGDGVIAQVRHRDCEEWELKQTWEDKGNETEEV